MPLIIYFLFSLTVLIIITMTKALWLTVAQCCGGKENKEAASAAAAAVCGKEEGGER